MKITLKKRGANIALLLLLFETVFNTLLQAQDLNSKHRIIEQSIRSIGDITVQDNTLLTGQYNKETLNINFGQSKIEINDSTNDLSIHYNVGGLKTLGCSPKVYRDEVSVNFNLADIFYLDDRREVINQQGMQIGLFWIVLWNEKGYVKESGIIKGKRVDGCNSVSGMRKIPFYYRKDIPNQASKIWHALDSSGYAARIKAVRAFFDNRTKVAPAYNEVNDYLTYLFRTDIGISIPPFPDTAPDLLIDFSRSYVMLVNSANRIRYYVTATNGLAMNLPCASSIKTQWDEWDFSLVDISSIDEDSTWSRKEKGMEIGKLWINLYDNTAELFQTAEVDAKETKCTIDHFNRIPLYYRKDIPGQKEHIINAIMYLKRMYKQ